MRSGSGYSMLVAATLVASGMCAVPVGADAAPVEAATDLRAPLTQEAAARLSQNVSRPVIVIMKNRQFKGDDAANDQAPVMRELNQVAARNIKSYRLVNSFAATVSDGELARLQANPAVDRVIPDSLIHRPRGRGEY
jgi:hypothetical protein